MEILFVLGLIVSLIGGLWLLIEAFKESVLWGLGCFLFSPVSLIFVILHWDVSKHPFLVHLAGIALIIVSAALAAPAEIPVG